VTGVTRCRVLAGYNKKDRERYIGVLSVHHGVIDMVAGKLLAQFDQIRGEDSGYR